MQAGHIKSEKRASLSSTYTKTGLIQRRLSWSLNKDDMQIHEAFHVCLFFFFLKKSEKVCSEEETKAVAR